MNRGGKNRGGGLVVGVAPTTSKRRVLLHHPCDVYGSPGAVGGRSHLGLHGHVAVPTWGTPGAHATHTLYTTSVQLVLNLCIPCTQPVHTL